MKATLKESRQIKIEKGIYYIGVTGFIIVVIITWPGEKPSQKSL